MTDHHAKYWIEKLNLLPHPEGGWFSETYRSEENLNIHDFDETRNGTRSFSTAIYYLLEEGSFGAFHIIQSDEIWHHYDGGTLRIITIDTAGNREDFLLGKGENEIPQAVVKAGIWFCAVPEPDSDFVLAGCTVSPGFDFQDFQFANADKLSLEFPEHETIIRKFSLSTL